MWLVQIGFHCWIVAGCASYCRHDAGVMNCAMTRRTNSRDAGRWAENHEENKINCNEYRLRCADFLVLRTEHYIGSINQRPIRWKMVCNRWPTGGLHFFLHTHPRRGWLVYSRKRDQSARRIPALGHH